MVLFFMVVGGLLLFFTMTKTVICSMFYFFVGLYLTCVVSVRTLPATPAPAIHRKFFLFIHKLLPVKLMKLRQMRLKTEAGESCKDGGAGLLD